MNKQRVERGEVLRWTVTIGRVVEPDAIKGVYDLLTGEASDEGRPTTATRLLQK